MSTPAPTPTARRRRLGVAAAFLVVGLVLAASALAGDRSYDGSLDPRNPAPDGAEALARVLDEQGVPVEVVRTQEALLGTDVAGAGVVVTNPEDLGRASAARLVEHAAGAAALVVVGTGDDVAARFLGEDDSSALPSRSRGTATADCDLPLAADLEVEVDQGTDVTVPGATSCFGDPGPLVSTDAVGPAPTWLLTAPELLANQGVAEAGNAALALRLLGQGDRLVWYVADPADTSADDGVRLTALLPPWLLPALSLVSLAGLLALLWRGRRLGPLVVEPLPVVVRAAESTRARGRAYHRARDRGHAAAVLREASRSRLARRLRLPADAPAEVVAGAVARTTTREHAAVAALLDPTATPARDTDLAELGRRLTALEDEVHHP